MASFLDRILGRGRETARPGGGTRRWIDVTPHDPKETPPSIGAARCEVRVAGPLAEVTQTLCIDNPNPRPTSANLVIPLPERAVVCGYALEVAGQLVEGVVVERERARVAFETEQRRGADPGLVEHTAGNAYRTRVYPVPARGRRTVRLSYVCPLLPDAAGALALDLELAGAAPELADVTVVSDEGTQIEVEGARELSVTERLGRVTVRARGLREGAHALGVRLAGTDAHLTLQRDDEGEVWFSLWHRRAPQERATESLQELTIVWDASGSRAQADHAAELELIEGWCAGLDSLRLVAFSDHVVVDEAFTDARALRAAIEKVAYDGATSFACLPADVFPPAGSGRAAVLVTDGLDTLSDRLPDPFLHAAALAVVSGRLRDVETCRQMMAGAAFGLEQAPRGRDALAQALARTGALRLAELPSAGVLDVVDLTLPGSPYLHLAGRLATERASIELEGTAYALDVARATSGRTVALAWAARRAQVLGCRAQENASELVALGRRFGIASPVTSLIVLETADQWIRYDIEPPASLTAIHEAWVRAKEGELVVTTEEQERENHLRELERAWADLLSWWEDPLPRARGAAGGPAPRTGAMRTLGLPENLVLSRSPDRLDSDFLAEPDALTSADIGLDYDVDDAFDIGATNASRMRCQASAPSAFSQDARPEGIFRSVADEETEPSRDEAAGAARRVRIRPWTGDTAHLGPIDQAPTVEAAYDAYLRMRAEHADAPSFFIDVAEWFFAHDAPALAATVASNLAELGIDDAALLRVLAWRLRQAGRLACALALTRRVRRLRPEDSQSARDVAVTAAELARALHREGELAAARAAALEAAAAYRALALTPWQRHPIQASLFAVEELNALRAWVGRVDWDEPFELEGLGAALEGLPDVDLRVTLAWDADECDVDLHVTEPTGEEAYYGNQLTGSGGRVSQDITDGYGPEEYLVRRAPAGTYVVRAHYYASHQQQIFGPATCVVDVFTDWGRTGEHHEVTSLRLAAESEILEVARVRCGDASLADDTADPAWPDPLTALRPGMGRAALVERYGEPSAEDGNTLNFSLAGGRSLVCIMHLDTLVRAFEEMPTGDQSLVCS